MKFPKPFSTVYIMFHSEVAVKLRSRRKTSITDVFEPPIYRRRGAQISDINFKIALKSLVELDMYRYTYRYIYSSGVTLATTQV